MALKIDFETYSECDLQKTGMFRYAEDPSTRILCLAYKDDLKPTKLWLPGNPIPPEFRQPGEPIWAWNVGFEMAIWEALGARHGFPLVHLSQWRDSMAVAAYFGFPLDLQRASTVAGGIEKDQRGKWLINQLCKPGKNNDDPALLAELYEYCKRDVEAEHSVHMALPRQDLPEAEHRLWFETFKANRRGVHIDERLTRNLLMIRNWVNADLAQEILLLTGGISATQVAALRDWLGIGLEDLTADTVRKALDDPGVPANKRRALEIRQALGKTSVKKLDSFLTCLCKDGAIKGAVVYYGAGTGRFAGRLYQLQNLPRGHFPVVEDYIHAIKQCPHGFEALFDKPMDAISTFIRPCLVPKPGMVMYDADYAAIEARVTAWLAGQESMLKAFRDGVDIYKLEAMNIFRLPLEQIGFFERFVGKQSVLGLGFQMGASKFHATCLNYGQDIGMELAERTVDSYRSRNFKIKDFWYKANDTLMKAIRNPGRVLVLGPCKVSCNVKNLFIKLPSGRTLTYPTPRISVVQKDWGPTPQIQYKGINDKNQWAWIDLYGGKITENIVQAIARDIMRDGIFRIIDAGFEFLLSVHDQILSQSTRGGRLNEFISLITEVPPWARGLPINAEGKECLRFSK